MNPLRVARFSAFFMCAVLSLYPLLQEGSFSLSSVLLLVDQVLCSLLTRHLEGVSPAWHSQNIARTMRIWLHLLTQVANMCFDQAGISHFIVAPHATADNAHCQHLSCMHHQQMEQAALGGKHFHFALTSQYFIAHRTQCESPPRDYLWASVCARM